MVWVAGVVLPFVVVKQRLQIQKVLEEEAVPRCVLVMQILWMKKELEGEVEPQCVVVESG